MNQPDEQLPQEETTDQPIVYNHKTTEFPQNSSFPLLMIAALLAALLALLVAFTGFTGLSASPAPESPSSVPLSLVFGSYEIQGRRDYMEDSHGALLDDLFLSKIALESKFAPEDGLGMNDAQSSGILSLNSSDWLLFGVFDGHGGPGASEFSANFLLSEIAEMIENRSPAEEEKIKNAMEEAFLRIDEGYLQEENAVKEAMRNSLSDSLDARTRQLRLKQIDKYGDGTTAIVVALHRTSRLIVTANAGDCRALVIGEAEVVPSQQATPQLSWLEEATQRLKSFTGLENSKLPKLSPSARLMRPKDDSINEAELLSMLAGFQAPDSAQAFEPFFPLSVDHKPHLPVERAFIEDHGGFVTFRTISRVNGILAISRALGDFDLKPPVRALPEIKFYRGNIPGTSRDISDSSHRLYRRDRFLVLASDGFYDVFTNDRISYEINRLWGKQYSLEEIAKILVQMAYKMHSSDNITVMIIDLEKIWKS